MKRRRILWRKLGKELGIYLTAPLWAPAVVVLLVVSGAVYAFIETFTEERKDQDA